LEEVKMKKKIMIMFFLVMLITVGQSHASIVYNLTFSDIDYTSVAADNQIGGFTATISPSGDWTIGTISTPYDTEWYFGIFSGGSLLYAADTSIAAPYEPLQNGILLQIISPDDIPLTLASFTAYQEVGSLQIYGGDVSASLNPVPIPSTILLLGGGLAALVGLRRRRS
jgi:hypothetical protein